MKIRDAHEKLKKLAKGNYCSTSYDITTFRGRGKDEVKCRLYIDGYNGEEAPDFATALQRMRAKLAKGKTEEEQTVEA